MPSILWNPKFTAYAFWFELALNNVVEMEAGTGLSQQRPAFEWKNSITGSWLK